MSAHLGTLLVHLVVHHASEHVLVGAPALWPAWVRSALRVFVFATICMYTHIVYT